MDEGLHLLLQEMMTEIRGCRSDVAELKQVNAEKRGERRVMLWLAGAVGGLVSFFVSFLQ